MSLPGHNRHLSNWKRSTATSKTPAKKKVQLNDVDIDQWMKRVEMASEFAVSEQVFHLKKSGISSHMVALQRTDQLQDHDDAYSEAQALLGDWMNSKLRLELEVGEDDEHLMGSTETSGPGDAFDAAPTTALDYSNFNEMYNQLAEEKEDCVVSSFLQDLMEIEVLDSGVAEDMALDTERKKRKKIRDPTIAMEARHRQVRENRAQRDAERERQQRERDARREAREEAKRREREEEARRKQEAHRQEEMVQQEMVRLRRRMEEKRGLEQKVRQRERERRDRERAASCLQSGPPLPTKQQDQDKENLYREQQIQARKQMVHLKSLQKHFSGWYSVLLQQRIRRGKAAALCDWKRQLRVWRAWRALVWAGTWQREAQRMEEELRAENRRCHMAMESDRRRLMKQCLNEWQLWYRRQREQRELLSQQEETRRKMAVLLSAASTGKLNTTVEPTAPETMAATPEMTDQPETTEKVKDIQLTQPHVRKDTQEDHQRSVTRALKLHPGNNTLVGAVARPTQPWQVTRRHAALTEGELRQARLRGDHAGTTATVPSQSKSAGASRFEHRHAAQQQTIAQQRKLLRDQQQQIAQLQEERSNMEAQGAAELTLLPFHAASKPGGLNLDPEEQRVHSIPEGKDEPSMALRKAIIRQPSPHPIVMAMEERARQRAERRSEVEELKRKKEREKLAGMKAAEEQRQREEEEEKCRAAERKREERRLQREREEEHRKQAERLQVLHRLAQLHHHRTLLVRRGMEPWKCLLQLSQANGQLAEGHHNLSVLRRCVLAWQQLASHTYAQKCASADRLHQHFLLRRGLCCWKRLKDWGMIQEARAERFYRMHTLRRILLALLDHVTQERLAEWDRQDLAQEHSDRRLVRGCFLAWRQFPGLLRMEKEREVRREKLRRRVAEVLPDFHSSPLECLREQPLL